MSDYAWIYKGDEPACQWIEHNRYGDEKECRVKKELGEEFDPINDSSDMMICIGCVLGEIGDILGFVKLEMEKSR